MDAGELTWRERLGYNLGRLLVRIMLLLLAPTTVRGAEYLPRAGAGIVVSNHIAAVDPGILVGALARPIALMSKVENYRGPLRPFFRLMGAFTVRRGAADRQALDLAAQVLARGRLLCMFPEGTRSRDGRLGPGHGGAALLALKGGVPIIPVALTGTQRVFLRGFPWLGRPQVTVTIGAPFRLDPPAGPVRRAERERAIATIMQQIAALLPPELRGSYAGEAYVGESAI